MLANRVSDAAQHLPIALVPQSSHTRQSDSVSCDVRLIVESDRRAGA
jgi:hypothetical protein